METAAGFRYSYDFNNDGLFEITNSTSASASVPASYLVTTGSQVIHARISDVGGNFTDYTTKISVKASNPTVAVATAASPAVAGQSVSFVFTATNIVAGC